jgi:hypothetical protein
LGDLRIFSYNLVNVLKSGESDMADIGVLYREARSLCMLSFDGFSLTFISISVIRLPTPSPSPSRGLMC